MSLSVLVHSASNLGDQKHDNLKFFTVVTLEGQKKRSTKVNNNNTTKENPNPVWDKKLTWNVPDGVDHAKSLQVEVYRREKSGSDKIVGSASIPLKDVINSGEQSHALTGENGAELNATTDLEVTYTAPGGGSGVKHKQLLSNQPTDFQVRVHVLEARKLLGNGSLNPVVKITCGREVQHTSTQKGTISPIFDEIFFFNFQERPDEMFDRVTEFKVLNAKKVVSDALIGSFRFDLGLVYKERDHCFIHKWLLLSDPDDPAGEAKGYLKISIQVLGPWDDPKPSPSLTEADQGSVDIESNLLRPSGVRLTPATLTVRIFRAEDLPQMDPEMFYRKKKSALVDPYCTVSFSGIKGKTPVIWGRNDPQWNQQINLPVKFPTMSERIKFQLKDKDTTNPDDFIGTCYLHMSQISALGENGFLPTFGPCFINCYGSPREYGHLPDKYDHLNKGLIEGVAYRGRVMVEVEMTLDQLPKTKMEKINVDPSRVLPFVHKDAKYKLFGALFSATMHKEYSRRKPIEFEVSIGLPDPAQRPVFSDSNCKSDGDHYYSLKWGGQPELEIDSQWEDCCQYRIECLNMILHCIDILRHGLDSLKKKMRYKDYNVEAAKEQLDKVLKSFERAVSQSLDTLCEEKQIEPVGELDQEDFAQPRKGEKDGGKPKGTPSTSKKSKSTEKDSSKAKPDVSALPKKVIKVTELDKHIKKLRVQELKALHTDCKLMPIHQMMVKIEEYIEQLERMAKVEGHKNKVNGSYHNEYLKTIWDTGNELNKDLGSIKKLMRSAVMNSDTIKDRLQEKLDTFRAKVSESLPELSLGSPDREQSVIQPSQFDVLTREHKVQEWEALRRECEDMPAQQLLQTMEEVEEFIDRLERMAHEPQNSIPDVIIWMISEGKRVVVKRIPSHELMYSSTAQSGKNCGKLMTIYLTPPAAEKEKEVTNLKDRIQLRCLLWLGLEEGNYREKWKKCLDAAKQSKSYYLRAYLYQARDMYASDRSGLSDPYAIVSYDCYSRRSRVVEQNLCPKWDETLIFDNQVEVFGHPESPPPVVVDFFDEDKLGKDEFLGSSTVVPSIRRNSTDPSCKPPKLDWIEIVRCNKPAGEVLAAFELLQEKSPEPPNAEPPLAYKPVPKDIAPELEKKTIEVLCWGVRDMKKLKLLPVDSPLVEVECGGVTERSQHIKDTKKNPNFPQPVFRFDVELPKDRQYCPPLNIQIFDKRTFGRLTLVGTHVIKSIDQFLVQTEHVAIDMDGADEQVDTNTEGGGSSSHAARSSDEIAVVDTEEEVKERKAKLEKALDSDPDSGDKSDFDWWSKYYYSIGDTRRTQKSYVERGYDRMVVYPGELEAAFNGFTDVAQAFPIYRGKGSKDRKGKSGQPVGYFKGSFKVYPQSTPPVKCPKHPSTDPVDVIVRVYIIKGIDLQPRDPDGKSDPYIKIKFGNKTVIDDKDNYLPSNLNPIFGKIFEFPATLPFDHTLTVSVMDWDRLTADDLIGETKIDLENRFLSQHRATCGLPESFSKRGPNKWRDGFLPTDILDDWIKAKGLSEAEWDLKSKPQISVTIDGLGTYEQSEADKAKEQQNDPYLSEMSDQRLALDVLRKQDLVPEHIETRNLYTPMHPGISQGQLHMWIDMFKKSDGVPPPPVDVLPRKPEKYVLRVVVWNTKDVILNERSLVAGDSMSDIYVKGWLRGGDDTQKTDVHYRSMNGEGNFNWRFVLPLEYLPTEKVMVVKKKEHFYNLTKTEKRLPPILTMQIWDNDLFSPDDFLGTIDFNLSAMPLPAKRSRNCSPRQITKEDKRTDLFKRKRIGGWWPAIATEKGKQKLTGKLELEFEILTEEEANLRPAAKGREEPNQNPKLDPPNRPKTSFLWFTSPWNSFKYIIWREHKCKIIWAIIAILCLIPIIAAIL